MACRKNSRSLGPPPSERAGTSAPPRRKSGKLGSALWTEPEPWLHPAERAGTLAVPCPCSRPWETQSKVTAVVLGGRSPRAAEGREAFSEGSGRRSEERGFLARLQGEAQREQGAALGRGGRGLRAACALAPAQPLAQGSHGGASALHVRESEGQEGGLAGLACHGGRGDPWRAAGGGPAGRLPAHSVSDFPLGSEGGQACEWALLRSSTGRSPAPRGLEAGIRREDAGPSAHVPGPRRCPDVTRPEFCRAGRGPLAGRGSAEAESLAGQVEVRTPRRARGPSVSGVRGPEAPSVGAGLRSQEGVSRLWQV